MFHHFATFSDWGVQDPLGISELLGDGFLLSIPMGDRGINEGNPER